MIWEKTMLIVSFLMIFGLSYFIIKLSNRILVMEKFLVDEFHLESYGKPITIDEKSLRKGMKKAKKKNKRNKEIEENDKIL